MADVTISGSSETTVNFNFGSDANNAAAQAALTNINKWVDSGAVQVVDVPTGDWNVQAPDLSNYTGVVGVIGGSSSMTDQLPVGYDGFINSSSGTVVVAGSQTTTLVESNTTGTFIFANNAGNTKVFLDGGFNAFFNGNDSSSATVNLGSPTTAGGTSAAIVDGARGSTTVNVYDGTLLNVLQGNVSVVAQSGTVAVEVSASSDNSASVVTVSGLAGTTIDYLPGGGNSFINAGAANVVVFNTGLGGSETLFGGTGSDTVLGGNGYFQGGSLGNNVLASSTVAGAATLVGGGNNDTLYSYGAGDLVGAGNGNVTLAGFANGGQTFVLGSGQDSLSGDAVGNDTIKLGSGSSTITLGHATVNNTQLGITSVASGNVIMEQSGISGGNVTINGFLPANVGWGVSDVVSLNAGVTATSIVVSGGSTVATLSDGTKITFAGVNGSANDSITAHNGYLS
jgi:serralysin